MKIPGLSDSSLKDLHSLIREALTADDPLSPGQKRWGVREYPDWRRQADEYEAELRKRKILFQTIKWDGESAFPSN